MNLHHLTHTVLQSVYTVFHYKEFVLDNSLFVEQLGDFAEVLSFQEIAVLILQVFNECGLFVDGLVLFVDGLEQDIVVLRKSLNPILELLLSEREQQFVHVVHTVLQIRNSDHEAIT